MIKLIATDMDGTLLDGNSKLPKNFFDVLLKLKEKNIKFAVASGRPYVTLYENFKPYSDEMYFICDNGAFIVEPNKNPIISVIDKNSVQALIDKCNQIPEITFLLCGVKHSYLKSNTPKEIQSEINKYYINQKVIEDFNEIDDDIFKITICDPRGSKDNSFQILNPEFGQDFDVVVSGAMWIDITNKGVNKGVALKRLQEDFHINYNETMVFGDFYNDVEMLKAAHYSFVMENANEDMKQYGNFIAKKNTESGVMQAIEQYVL